MGKLYLILNFALAVLVLGLVLMCIQNVGKRILNKNGNDAKPLARRQNTGDERRRNPRFEVKWPATVESDGHATAGEIKNISIEGAFIQCEMPLPMKEIFRVTIEVPDREPIQANAQVVWTNAYVPKDKVISRGMGVRFLEISNEDRQFIKSQGDELASDYR